MRLSEQTQQALITVLTRWINKTELIELRLYGSRVNDALRGGDIDLLLITQTPELAHHLKQNKPHIFGALFSLIDEEKIDLLIIDKPHLNNDPFAQQAFTHSILLNTWNK